MNIPFIDPHIAGNLAATVGAAAILLPVRSGLMRRASSRAGGPDADAQHRLARIRLVFGLLLALTLGAIWFAEIQSLLWSVTAVIVAFVIATKELIQCGTGALMRAAGRSFRVGDRLEIDGLYGEIVAHGILTTTIAEMEKGSAGRRATGRRIVLPNSRLFSADLRIEDRGQALSALRFNVIFDPAVSAQAAVSALEDSLQRFCEPFAQGWEDGMEKASLVTVGTTEMGRIRLDVLCFVPAEEAVALEREVKMEFLEWLWAEAQARQARAPAERRFAAVNDRIGRAA